ncbi:unnamed protein product [Bursaphelenchus okinawaensis]|uniref:Uncharacterized protein n=1 Tax=Bursaphelenchus okinawaensis TaxID=465554 RepID=A0A811KD81_9BILA|nr:unnamed protein product [Bursaphelenchus okinawaensis]CAG9097795.1 unnamed protein product [Bursaphelenchus okinawaensis]
MAAIKWSFLLLLTLQCLRAEEDDVFGEDEKGTYILALKDNYGSGTDTYKQYYTQTHNGTSNVHILYILGEAPNEVKTPEFTADSTSYPDIVDDLHETFNATVFKLEHRYYSRSYPVHNPETAKDFKYLSSDQAIEDLSRFIRAQNEIIPNAKWVVIGGSYPGMLSLWFRQMYPDLTVGAISSSAPIKSVVNFTSFMEISQEGYKKRNPECHGKLEIALKQFTTMIKDQNKYDDLKKLYKDLSKRYDLTNEHERNWFSYHVVSDAYTQIQFNVDGICKNFDVKTEKPLTEMASHFEFTADDFQNKTWGSWLWQVCNEFGFFYSPNDKSCFAKGSYDIKEVFQKECEQRFGSNYTYEQIEKYVQNSWDIYGVTNIFNTKNMIITNSELDPWSGQGLTQYNTDDKSIVTFTIQNGTHCHDLKAGNNPHVFEARKKYKEEIRKWLADKPKAANSLQVSVIGMFVLCFFVLFY